MRLYKPEQRETSAFQASSAAKQLYKSKNYRGCANRAYCAAYQAAVGVCVRHGDVKDFPPSAPA